MQLLSYKFNQSWGSLSLWRKTWLNISEIFIDNFISYAKQKNWLIGFPLNFIENSHQWYVNGICYWYWIFFLYSLLRHIFCCTKPKFSKFCSYPAVVVLNIYCIQWISKTGPIWIFLNFCVFKGTLNVISLSFFLLQWNALPIKNIVFFTPVAIKVCWYYSIR